MRPSRTPSEVLSVLSVRVLSVGRFLRSVLSVLSVRFLGVLRFAPGPIGRRLCSTRKAAVVCLLSSSLRLFSHLPGTIHCLFFRQMRQMGTDKTDKTTMSYKHGPTPEDRGERARPRRVDRRGDPTWPLPGAPSHALRGSRSPRRLPRAL